MIRVCVPGAGTERSPRAAPISGIRDLQLLLGNILRRRSGLGPGVQRSRQHHGRRRRLKRCMIAWHWDKQHRHVGGGWIFVRQPGHTNTGSICLTAPRVGRRHPSPVLVRMILLSSRVPRRLWKVTESSTKMQPRDARPNRHAGSPPSVRVRRLVSRRSSETVLSAQTDFQPIPLGSTQGESRAPGAAAC